MSLMQSDDNFYLIPQNNERTCFEGFINVHGQEHQFQISLPPGGTFSQASVQCDLSLQQMLQGYEAVIEKRLQQSQDLATFLLELKTIAESQAQKMHLIMLPPPSYYKQLLTEIEELDWKNVSYVDTSLQQLHLRAMDQGGREHILKIHISSEHPVERPICTVDLPIPFNISWSSQTGMLQFLYKQFQNMLETLQDFWNQLDEIDSKTWILEPENPIRGASKRRIALGNNSSVQIQVDPKNPRLPPECKLLGADHVINPLNSRIGEWNPEDSILNNLERVLNVQFPSPANSKKEDFNMECGICYAYRLEMEIPDKACDDQRCGQPFHQTCLYEWLRALPSSRQSFNTIFGECPYCNKPITVKMPS
ncbi:E3 ubiquitin-protein ligase FANCL [Lingula anatina]|uniref:E3 ubiquitin-protein ligase FANCL n=1 Tax=Lingula anatina TaxID=7574 RepID=A0A1S3JC07_LINAN|nr:E3 ubiquitin-protein ligase FANCL [Lingula anatina]|eukprot:XP_013407858.1 E3 ubiquitin-protein ligase FANCL [Lingula anatina]